MRPTEQTSLPLLQAAEELLPLAADAVLGFPGVQPDLPGPDDKCLPEDGAQLPLVEEVEHARADAVEVDVLVAQGDGAGVGAEGGDDLLREAGGEVEGEGRGGGGGGRGEGEHLGEPQG